MVNTEENTTEKYNQEWFKARALSSLKRINNNSWDYSDSLLLYISTGVNAYEALQEEDSSYFKLVTKPEQEYLVSIAKNIAEKLPNGFEYIDLGPGTEHKEQFFFDELKKQRKEFTYIPVDISNYYLSLAESHASEQGIPVHRVQSSFEELPEVLSERKLPRFVSLGATFPNYDPQVILKLLKSIAGKDGFVLINSQMRDRVDMIELQKIYGIVGLALADEKLKLLGLNPDTDLSVRTADDGIKVWCEVFNPSEEIKRIGVKQNDKLLVIQSIRYTKDSLEEELKKTGSEYEIFDTGSSFIASLIRT